MTRRTPVAPTRLGVTDLADEAVAGLVQRPGRSALTALGTLLGVGAFVAVLGLTATASGQISERFTVLAATEVVVEQTPLSGPAGPAVEFPEDADARIAALNGVAAAGVMWTVDNDDARVVSAVPLAGSLEQDSGGEQVPVMAASPGALQAMRPVLDQGRAYDVFHESRAESVAVLGAGAARRLGISRLDAQPAVFVNGTPLTVIGVIGDVARQADTLLAVLVPRSTATALWGTPEAPPRMLIETELGAAQLVGSQAALALRPDNPQLFTVLVPPDPRTLRENVETDLAALFLLLAGVSLVIGAVGIANTTLVAVLERVPEIGLRRALGARPRHITAQFLTEATALGTLGGLVGTSLGILTVVAVAAARQWTAILEPWATLPAPLIGSLIGLVAGAYPAIKASRIEPADALRR